MTRKFSQLPVERQSEFIGELVRHAISDKRCFDLGNELIAIGKAQEAAEEEKKKLQINLPLEEITQNKPAEQS